MQRMEYRYLYKEERAHLSSSIAHLKRAAYHLEDRLNNLKHGSNKKLIQKLQRKLSRLKTNITRLINSKNNEKPFYFRVGKNINVVITPLPELKEDAMTISKPLSFELNKEELTA